MKQYKSKIALFFATTGWWLLWGISVLFRLLFFIVTVICYLIGVGLHRTNEWLKDRVQSIKPKEYEYTKSAK